MVHNAGEPLRFRTLIQNSLQTMTLRELSTATGVPVSCLNDYVIRNIEPRMAVLKRLADYYDESLPALLISDELKAELINEISRMTPKKMKEVMELIKGDVRP